MSKFEATRKYTYIFFFSRLLSETNQLKQGLGVSASQANRNQVILTCSHLQRREDVGYKTSNGCPTTISDDMRTGMIMLKGEKYTKEDRQIRAKRRICSNTLLSHLCLVTRGGERHTRVQHPRDPRQRLPCPGHRPAHALLVSGSGQIKAIIE